jgi:hypothetical protein
MTLDSFIASLPSDTISALPFSERVRLLRELVEIDRTAGIDPMSADGLLHDPETLPAPLRIAGTLCRAVEEYRLGRAV